MIALQYSQFGNPLDVLAAVDIDSADPGAGQVRLRLLRSPIHNHDLATIRGVYGVKPELPAIGGSEMLGIVDAVGVDAPNVNEGARVVCGTQQAWAEYALAPASALIPVPESIADDQACQLLAMPLSALVLLDELGVQSGDWIVQNAANGTVGRILVREATHRGINVVSLVRSEETAQQLRDFGAPHVVVTEGEWTARVNEIVSGSPIVRVVDSVAGSQSIHLQHLLAKGGELIVFGGLAAEPMRLDPGLLISREQHVRGFWMTAWMKRPENASRMTSAMHRVFELALAGDLPISAAGVYSLSESYAALTAAQAPGRSGKILFKP